MNSRIECADADRISESARPGTKIESATADGDALQQPAWRFKQGILEADQATRRPERRPARKISHRRRNGRLQTPGEQNQKLWGQSGCGEGIWVKDEERPNTIRKSRSKRAIRLRRRLSGHAAITRIMRSPSRRSRLRRPTQTAPRARPRPGRSCPTATPPCR